MRLEYTEMDLLFAAKENIIMMMMMMIKALLSED